MFFRYLILLTLTWAALVFAGCSTAFPVDHRAKCGASLLAIYDAHAGTGSDTLVTVSVRVFGDLTADDRLRLETECEKVLFKATPNAVLIKCPTASVPCIAANDFVMEVRLSLALLETP